MCFCPASVKMSSAIEKTVRQTIRQSSLLRPGDRVLVAVSGGPDSVCLLHLLRRMSEEFGISIHAAHLDHQLRPESGREADFVRDLCARWGVPLAVRSVEIAAEARRRRMGIEETAREVRRDFLRETAVRQECRVVALGHHRGDQAETVLHRFLRGSGSTGLAGMQAVAFPFVRPLLEVSRAGILAYLQQNQLSWVEDPSNYDRVFTRNRLRNEILPLLREFNPRLEESLAGFALRTSIEEDFWREQTEVALLSLSTFSQDDCRLDCQSLQALHPALRARALRQALNRLRGGLHGIAAIHLEHLEALLQCERPQADLHLPGVWVGRRYDCLWLRRTPPPAVPEIDMLIAGPGLIELPHAGWLQISLEAAAQEEGPLAVEFDPERVAFPLRLRHFRPGDRFRPAGLGGQKKVKNIFIDMKMDRESRRRVLFLEGTEILWLIGIRRCEGGRPKPGSAALRFQFRPCPDDNLIVKSLGLC